MSGIGGSDSAVARTLLTRLKQVLKLTNTSVWVVDLEAGTVDFFGPVEDVTGLSPRELDDPMAINERAIHPDDQDRINDAFQQLFETRDPIDVEYRTHPDNGAVRWLRSEAFLEEEHGEPEQMATLVGMSTDVTRLKEQEARLEEFASVVSHDLRNPLAVAKGRLELARETHGDDEHLETVAQTHDRMEALVDDLLTLSKSRDVIQAIDAVALENVVEDAWSTADTADATFDITTEQAILADENRLRQLLENLFRNAAEHGGDDVTVRVGALENGFFVEDDGRGMPAEERKTLFDTAATMATSPTGLGLSIVSEIAKAHDWGLGAVDGDAGGARFEFTGIERLS